MPKRMLIDATHAEETRVVVLDGNRLEDFDIETSTKRQLKGNIYLAKVVRVEPSLQAAFVEYGGNRHGFLAFSEIHPDYYQIPVADRQRLLDLQAEQARLEDEEDDLELALSQTAAAADDSAAAPLEAAPDGAPVGTPDTAPPDDAAPRTHTAPTGERREEPAAAPDGEPQPESWAYSDLPRLVVSSEDAPGHAAGHDGFNGTTYVPAPAAGDHPDEPSAPDAWSAEVTVESWAVAAVPALIAREPTVTAPASIEADAEFADDEQPDTADDLDMFGSIPEEAPPETIGGGDSDVDSENGDDRPERRIPPRFLRNYHIQEVIHRRQILLVQVVKEERGTKGAALTTYLSLAGRFSVLMPNSPRGGGISRKITSAADRRRLKEIMVELDVPKGMGLIVRTAGAQRPKPEIKRDCEYLMRLWDDIREHTLKSIAPALIYEEASLIKRAIRDVYSRDIDDITIDGEESWRQAHEFMRMLMPSHARKVHLWPDQGQSLFARFQVEAQLDAMLQPTVQLRSGGYLVINQAEALVAIDVNSGRSTRERNVEETALRTNLEAADEVARQLRLRDLAGLIVIDFIDMESKRHNAMVERRLKEALKDDRARIQVGHISHFGLMEMSRQRLRPSLEETTLIVCPHCNGTGHVRGTESAALHVLRGVEEEAGKRRSAEIVVHVAMAIALYILNHKRERLNEIERRYGMRVIIAADDSLIAPRFRIERLRALVPGEEPRFVTPDAPRSAVVHAAIADAVVEPMDAEDEEDLAEADEDTDAAVAAGTVEDTEESREAERRRRRRRRRRRGGRDDDGRSPDGQAAPGGLAAPGGIAAGGAAGPDLPFEQMASEAHFDAGPAPVAEAAAAPPADDDDARRRSRRGGRRRGRGDGNLSPLGVPGAEQPDLVPVYAGPTPADPFGSGHVFDIFDVMEQAELNAAPVARAPAGRRGQSGRSRWQPPHWAVASEPPMLAGETATTGGRSERGPAAESWALPSRPFMLRRDRHAPRWRGGQAAAASGVPTGAANVAVSGAPGDAQSATASGMATGTASDIAAPVEATASVARAVPIEAGPPPSADSLAPEVAAAPAPVAVEPAVPPSDIAEPSQRPSDAMEQPALSSVAVEPAAKAPEPMDLATSAEAPAPGSHAEPAQGARSAEAQAELHWSAAPDAASDAHPPAGGAHAGGAGAGAPVADRAAGAPDSQPDAAPEAPPVPANDVVSGPVVQPIVIGSESTPPVERKRGWWRRR